MTPRIKEHTGTTHLGSLTREFILACFFCHFSITLASTLAFYCTLSVLDTRDPRAASVLDIYGTFTPSAWRRMHRTLARPVCTLQHTQPQLRASRCSPGYLRCPSNRRRLPSSTCCNNVGPSFGKKRMCCPRSGLQMTRVRGLPHIRVSQGPSRERLAPGEDPWLCSSS